MACKFVDLFIFYYLMQAISCRAHIALLLVLCQPTSASLCYLHCRTSKDRKVAGKSSKYCQRLLSHGWDTRDRNSLLPVDVAQLNSNDCKDCKYVGRSLKPSSYAAKSLPFVFLFAQVGTNDINGGSTSAPT